MQSETLYNLIKFASFCVTVLLSFGLAAFCCAKLCTKLGEGEKSMYMSMLTSVVSLWIPSPTSMMTLRMSGGANEPPAQDKRVRSRKLITDGGIMEEDHVVEMESATVQQKEARAKKEEEEDE